MTRSTRWWRSRPALPADGPVGTTVRAVVRATPETFTLARRRAQPRAVYIARLTLTAVFAYLIALRFAGSGGPVLAPLTALLVIQVSLSHTLRSAGRRVLSVVAGVLVAVGLSVVVGFTWWSLAVVIAVALAVGVVLRLGDDILEVPISAMLILAAVGSKAAASGRIVETLIGAAAGLIGGLLFAPVRLQPAEEAIDDLSGQLARLLGEIAADVGNGADAHRSAERLAQARALGGEIQRVESALSDSEESLRLNPRARILPQAAIPLRTGLETLEHAAVTVRAIARWAADASRTDAGGPMGDRSEAARLLSDPAIRGCLADVLGELATAIAAIGDHIRAGIAVAVAGPAHPGPAESPQDQAESPQERVETELGQSLARARLIQDKLAEMLRDPGRPDWSMRGELLMLLERLRSELQEEHRARVSESWPVRGSARRRHPRWVPPQPPRGRRTSRPDTRPRAHERPDTRPRAHERRGARRATRAHRAGERLKGLGHN